VLGATSGQNSATISPSLVLITATSLAEFIGFCSSALTDATASMAASKLIKIDFMTESCASFQTCEIKQRKWKNPLYFAA
jgi:hypothetical protein